MTSRHLAVAALLSTIILTGCSSDDVDGSVGASRSEALAASSTAEKSLPEPAASETPPVLPSDLLFQSDGIRVQPADGTGSWALAAEGPAGQEHPDWSPDGASVVFDADYSTLWTVRSDGDGLQQVYDCVEPCHAIQDPAWSPDGRAIAFMEVTTRDGRTTASAKIQILTLEDMSVRTVHQDTRGTEWIFAPRFSPDGGSIVFEQDTYASPNLSEDVIVRARIGVLDLEGVTKPRFIASGTDQPPASPDWSPAGDLVIFSMGGNLVTVLPDGSRQQVLTDYDGQTEHAIQPTFGPMGDRIVFTYVTGAFGVDDEPSAAMIGLTGAGLQILVAGGTHPRLKP